MADQLSASYPTCAGVIRNDFYMDDLITGCDEVEEAVETNEIIHRTLSEAKFPPWKYISNSELFLNSLNSSLIESTMKERTFDTIKVLGLHWVPESDELGVTYRPKTIPDRLTKRQFLSEIASVFDVFGMLAPVTVASKLLMQQFWQEKIGWDDHVPLALEKRFRLYYSNLKEIGAITIIGAISLVFDQHPAST